MASTRLQALNLHYNTTLLLFNSWKKKHLTMKKEDLTLAYKPALVERRLIFSLAYVRPIMKYVVRRSQLFFLLCFCCCCYATKKRDLDQDLFLKHWVFLSISLYAGEGSPPVLLFDIFWIFEEEEEFAALSCDEDIHTHTYRIKALLSFTSTHTSYDEKGI